MSQFKEGQSVYCLICGEGVVTSVIEGIEKSEYPIIVNFTNFKGAYTSDGRWITGRNVVLYASKPEIILPKWQPTPGQWCWFWDYEHFIPRLNKFDRMNGGKYRDMDNIPWENCAPFIGELPEHMKEAQP